VYNIANNSLGEFDVDQLMEDVHYKPETMAPEGIKCFVAWYREYYGVQE